MMDIPLIKEKNDVRIDAGVSLLLAAHATISYGLTDILAIQAGGDIHAGKHRAPYHIHGAAGLFKKNIMELYVGFGYGYYSYSHADIEKALNGNYQQFMPFNIGLGLSYRF